MNNFKTKIAILAISFVSFVGIQSASAVEGMSIGAAYNYSGFMATGKETQGGTTQSLKKMVLSMQRIQVCL